MFQVSISWLSPGSRTIASYKRKDKSLGWHTPGAPPPRDSVTGPIEGIRGTPGRTFVLGRCGSKSTRYRLGLLLGAARIAGGLTRCGVLRVLGDVAAPSPVFGTLGPAPAKLLIIDGHTAFTGGINFSGAYSGGSLSHPKRTVGPTKVPWRDTHVKIEGPVVAEFQKLFLATWNKQRGDRLPRARYFPAMQPQGYHVVRAIGSTPDSGISVIHTTLLSAIAHAERTIHITNTYFIPDRQLLEQLKEAAKRGVEVRLILPSQTDFWVPLYAGHSHYDELLNAGAV